MSPPKVAIIPPTAQIVGETASSIAAYEVTKEPDKAKPEAIYVLDQINMLPI